MNMGIKLLSTSLSSLVSFEWFDGYMSDAGYWGWLNSGGLQPQYVSNTADGPVTITAQAPQTLAPGASAEVFYLLALGTNEQALLTAMTEGQQKYDDLFSGLGDVSANPNALRLGTNHPNPFNGQTRISYYLPSNGNVSLKVFDQLGNEVAAPVSETQSAGIHHVDFESNGLAAGLYYYTLVFGDKQLTHKMVITE